MRDRMLCRLLAGALALTPLLVPAARAQEPEVELPEAGELALEIPGEEEAAPPPPPPSQAELDAAAREAALHALELDVAARIDELAALRAQVEALLSAEEDGTPAEIATLISLYSSMKPKNAASVMESLPIALAAQVLAEMPARKAGKILDVMRRDRAVTLSKLVAGER